MTQRTARMSPAVRIVTAGVLTLTAVMFVGAFYVRPLAFAAAALMLLSAFCYLTAPIGYELEGGRLTIFTHLGRTQYGPIIGCSRVRRSIFWGLRLFGNGGVFAGTGYYWSPSVGVYRAYVTSARRDDMLLIETAQRNVLITPEDPESFIANCSREFTRGR